MIAAADTAFISRNRPLLAGGENPVSRIGIGYDVHRLGPGRRLVLGGVEIPSSSGPIAHSDGDVVLHALCDAILGGAGQPDIGELFPDRDPRWKDADSRQFVAEALRRAAADGLFVSSVDLVIHAEQPRLGVAKEHIRAALAGLLGLSTSRIGVKATTHEGLDAIGRGEAIACTAAVVLAQRPGGA